MTGVETVCVDCEMPIPIEVLQTVAGYYIGQWCNHCGPYSRLSGYFRTRQEADAALASGDWTPRSNP